MSNTFQRPRARADKLIVEVLDQETLVYDQTNARTLCLNASASAIWKSCDGSQTLEDIASVTKTHDVAIVESTIAKLAVNGLLAGEGGQAPQDPSRRAALRRLVTGASITTVAASLPIITVMTAPTPAQAMSLGAPGSVCTDGSQCVSGSCSEGGRCQG